MIFQAGQRFVLREDFAQSAAYQTHRRKMEELPSFERVLEELELISRRLHRAAKVDHQSSREERQDARRSRMKGSALFRRLCVAYDLHLRVPYAQRFLNTLARHNASSGTWRGLAERGIRVFDDLLFRSDWRGVGNRPQQRLVPLPDQVQSLRRDLSSPVRQIWRESHGDVLERGAKLTRLLKERRLNIAAVPKTVLKRAPSRVLDFIVAGHFGISQVATRRTPVRHVDLVFGGQ
ncbi:MAG: hypothetical protein A3I61_03965 [Acidobacteria bacterium RIFCSPLOWO2_02_FULL_68_18]|nr:MAG: hypothetical protein A3I61_03965 [Acidobacteria bacterium RIFCSPLOWO2_02_FULL_68_18]OFW48822.1 MAG: hypothetical protein A3G77_17900 [Acidobacteria bacterium RIFCSPLOWO2_12_FULL_68_19]